MPAGAATSVRWKPGTAAAVPARSVRRFSATTSRMAARNATATAPRRHEGNDRLSSSGDNLELPLQAAHRAPAHEQAEPSRLHAEAHVQTVAAQLPVGQDEL